MTDDLVVVLGLLIVWMTVLALTAIVWALTR